MGQVSGFWLTWYYFGYSAIYGNFIGLAQIIGALLLTFERTALLGACALVPVLVNIILIDISYRIDMGATMIAILLLAAVTGLIASRRKELLAILWPKTEPASRASAVAGWISRLTMLALAFGFTYWTANYNNRTPTPIDGAWEVVQGEPETLAKAVPKVLFFEYNRAFMVVFKSADGVYTKHHFEVDQSSHRIEIRQTWLSKGREIFSGTYLLRGDELELNGVWQGQGQMALRLRRRPPVLHSSEMAQAAAQILKTASCTRQ